MSFGGQAIQFVASFQASLHGQALIILQLACASLQHGIWAPERQSRTFQSSSGLALDIQKITSTTFHWSKQVIGQSRSQRREDRPTSWCDEQPIGGGGGDYWGLYLEHVHHGDLPGLLTAQTQGGGKGWAKAALEVLWSRFAFFFVSTQDFFSQSAWQDPTESSKAIPEAWKVLI